MGYTQNKNYIDKKDLEHFWVAEAISTKQDKTLSNEVAEALSGDGTEVHTLDDALLRLNEKAGTGGGGEPGQDGFSPTVEVSKTGKVTTVTITDKTGTHTATINDGADGQPGTNGTDGAKGDKGEDGVSPTIAAVRVSNGVQLTITDKNGSHSAVINDGIGDGSSVATFADVPNDGKSYLRQNGTWVEGATKAELAEIGAKVGEIDQKIGSSSIIDLSQYSELKGVINNGAWSGIGSTSYKYVLVPADNLSSISVTANSENGSSFAFLRDYVTPVKGEKAIFSDGYTAEIKLNADEIKEYEVPQNTKYIYVSTFALTNKIPTIKTGGAGLVADVKAIESSVNDLKVSVDTVSESIALIQQNETEIRNEFTNSEAQIKANTEEIFRTEYSHGTYVFKHLNNKGNLEDSNFSISFVSPVVALKGSVVSCDSGYKYQCCLYDKQDGKFLQRITWKTDSLILQDDYKVRLEIATIDEEVLTDMSIQSNLHYSLVSSRTSSISEIKKEISADNLANIDSITNLVETIGINLFENKRITITRPNGVYNAWSFVETIGDKMVCLYCGMSSHNSSVGDIRFKISSDGVVWSKEQILMPSNGKRVNIYGLGKDENGDLFIWVGIGMPTSESTYYELYKTSDGINYDKISTLNMGNGGPKNIFYVPSVGLMSIYHKYGSSRSWGYVSSNDGGRNWTIHEVESNLSPYECPVESTGVYIGEGKIIAIGRRDATQEGLPNVAFQMQSSDYGASWQRYDTNISDINSSTIMPLYDGSNIDLYYIRRSSTTAKLFHRKSLLSAVWNAPTNWNASELLLDIVTGGASQDSGNVHGCKNRGSNYITWYSGIPTECGIYGYINT